MFDLWCLPPVKGRIAAFFGEYLSDRHEEGKILAGKDTDLFAECCHTSGLRNNRQRRFSFPRFLLLYAFVLYLENQDSIKDSDFRRRLRILNNLINNSPDTLRADCIQGLMAQTREIVVEGKVKRKEQGQDHFNNTQAQEEYEKLAWTEANSELAPMLFRLEDHPLLNGCIGIIGLENVESLCDKFFRLFPCDEAGNLNCNLDVVSRTMAAIGDYGQPDHWRYQLASPDLPRTWRELFGPVRDRSKTKAVLQELLTKMDDFSEAALNGFCDDYIQQAQQMPWTYYLAKYDSMRRSHYGKYYWRDRNTEPKATVPYTINPYSLIMMTTEVSLGGWNFDVFLKTLYDLGGQEQSGLVLEKYSYSKYHNEGTDKLYIPDKGLYLTVEKDCYKVLRQTTGEKDERVDTIEIPHNADSIDTADRIEIGLSVLKKLLDS